MFSRANHIVQNAGGIPIVFAVAVSVILGTAFFLGIKNTLPPEPKNIVLAACLAGQEACGGVGTAGAYPYYTTYDRTQVCNTSTGSFVGSVICPAGYYCALTGAYSASCIQGCAERGYTCAASCASPIPAGTSGYTCLGGGVCCASIAPPLPPPGPAPPPAPGPSPPSSVPANECGDFTETTYPAFIGPEGKAEGCNTLDSRYGVGPNGETDWTVNNIRNHGLVPGCVRGHTIDTTDGCYSGHYQTVCTP